MNRSPVSRNLGTIVRSTLALALLCALHPVHAANASGAGTEGSDTNADANADANYDPFSELEGTDDAGDRPPAYQDRIIAPEKLERLPAEEDDTDAGLPRAFHIDLIAHSTRFANERSDELGVGVGGFWDTESLGTLSVDALLFRSDGARDGNRWRGTATLWQRGLQMPGGWTVNNGLGVLNTPMPDTLREQYRFFLPSVPVLGVSTEWRRSGNRSIWTAAVGRGGGYGGTRLSGFESGDGNVATVGAQWAWSDRWTGAVSALATDGRVVPESQGLPAFQTSRSQAVVFGNRWQGAHDSVSANLQTSHSDRGAASGLWVDARSERGRLVHRYGLFYLEPDLVWGAWPINNDVRGGYYRVEFNRARWSANVGVDRIASISGKGFDGWYGNAYARYQASSRLGYGGGLSARDNSASGEHDRAQALQLFADLQSYAGQTRLQFDTSRDSRSDGSWQVLVDHALRLHEGSRLSLSAGYGRIADDDGRATRTLTLASYGGIDLTDTLSINGTVRWTRSRGDQDAHGLDMNLGWQWRIAPRWSLLGNIADNRGSRRSPFLLDPLTNQAIPGTQPHDRSAFVTLRYDFSAGRRQGVLGGPPNAATGRISGSLFLDENNDGVRSATEQPAANVTLVLDGMYTVRTDDLGRFQFGRVAVGEHQLTVVPDNLPLPWSIGEERASRMVKVEVRQDTVVDIAASRQR